MKINKMKIKKMVKITSLICILLITSVILMTRVLAVGVSCEYYEGNPLILNPGDTLNVTFRLQNMVGNEDLTLRGKLVEGMEVATILDENTDYSLPFGTENLEVTIRIDIPTDAQIGDTHNVGMTFTTVTLGEQGRFTLGKSIGKHFEVVVVEKSKPDLFPKIKISGKIILGIIVIIILLVLVILTIRKKYLKTRK